jgi:hypothetical protein
MKESRYFDQICEYKDLIDTNKLYGFSLFDKRTKNTKILSLYKLINSDFSENEIATSLGYEDKSCKNFRKLQKRLLAKLESSLFFLDDSKQIFTDLGLKYYKLLKSTFQHRTLIMLRKRNLSLFSIEKIIQNAVENEFPDLVISLVSELIPYYGYIKPNEKKFNYYCKLSEDNLIKYQVELNTYKTYSSISKIYLQKQKDISVVLSQLNKYLAESLNYNKTVLTHKSILWDFQLKSLYYQLSNRFDEIIKLSKETLDFLEHKSYDTYFFAYMINVDLVNAFKYQKNYGSALTTIINNLENHKTIDLNWFKLKSSQFNILVLQKNYNNAYEVLYDTLNTYNNLKIEKIKEEWNIKEAYVAFIAELGYIDQELLNKKPLKEFRLNRFLNDVPVYSKQKRSLNISILIIQMLFYLQQNKVNAFIDRMDALNQYTYRYLRNDDTLRSNCFIKMLLKIPDARYHHVAIQRHVQKLYKKLKETPPSISDQTTDVEIIPYETLWEMVLELLEKNR